MKARNKRAPNTAGGADGVAPKADDTALPGTASVPTESIDLQIADVLHAVHYPVNKDHIVETAREAGASNELLAILDGLPEQDYADVDSVTRLLSSNYGPGLSS
ncbi:hypothetical protein LMG24076_01410 [Trinickia soli]|uniref:DUF2795 domain-containing protein n=1 Tax=Trinickia soli TaxID=380675 RepID=A0A2N7WDZ0_9BURK|nr:DUF2795 domain-containing protein [Paraburkholderia sp. T12-10]PMS27650.1 hypothetical protein C0Z19_02935 [Trinickia soli]CAB3660202.1 hypothetical protein LMG24076_01410 [Trinickia soli]